MDCLRALASQSYFIKTDAPQEPQKYKVEITLPRFDEYMSGKPERVQEADAAPMSKEELDRLVYGDPHFASGVQT